MVEYIRTGIAQRSRTPIILTAVSGKSIPANLQTVQIIVIQQITKRLTVHSVFLLMQLFLSSSLFTFHIIL